MTKYWEIVQLSDGSFALQSTEENEAPLVRIEFSPEAEEMLNGETTEIARIMIGAGVQAASISEEEFEEPSSSEHQTLH